VRHQCWSPPPPPPGVDGTTVDSYLSGARSPSLRSTVPLPFVRKMRLHMDSCPSTNKSQFFFGGLAMLLACGILDCAQVLYMVVGHTKFGPDLVARSLAGAFNRSDMYNHGGTSQTGSRPSISGESPSSGTQRQV